MSRSARRVLSFALAALPLAIGTPAQLLGPEFQVNSYTTGGQAEPAVSADEAGNFVVVWQSFGQDGSGDGVFGQRFDPAGIPVGTELQISSHSLDSQATPALAAASTGAFVVVWASDVQDGSQLGVFGQRFDAAGLPVGSEFQINSQTTGSQFDPAVAADSAGGFVVVWTTQRETQYDTDVVGRRFDAAGLPVGSEFQVNTWTPYRQLNPSVAVDGAGGFIVVWDCWPAPGGAVNAVLGQRFDPSGLPVGNEFQVNSYALNFVGIPEVDANGAGAFVVVWASLPQDGSEFGVFGQQFDAQGLPAGSEFRVNGYTTGSQMHPAVAVDALGRFTVAWESNAQDGSSWGVFGRRFDTDGSPLGSEFRVSTFTTDMQRGPSVAVDGSGAFVVVWDSSEQDGSGSGVFGQMLSSPPFFYDGFEQADFSAWSWVCNDGDICP